MIAAAALMISGALLAAVPASSAAKPVIAATASKSAAAAKPAAVAAGEAGFDSTRAFRYLSEQCSLGPRNPGSEGHARAIGYFEAHFKGLGMVLGKQDFVHADMATGRKVALTNLIAVIPGRDPKLKPVIFCAHWDTRPRADQENSMMLSDRPILGANDGASGAAVLMELANVLKKKAPLQTVYLVFFDGEDYGREGNLAEYFLGARHFAENLPAREFAYALLFDMVGDKHLNLPMEENSVKQSPEIVRKIWARAKSLNLAAFEPRVGPSVMDDHMPLQAKGIPAVDIIDFEYPHWHTLGDTPDKCSAHSLGVVGRLAASLALRGLP